MSNLEETLQQLIEYSQKQRAAQERKLRASGKSTNNVIMDAYASIIRNLSSLLPTNKDKKPL